MSKYWPVENENDASQVTAALLPFDELTSVDMAVLLVHHPNKGGGTEGRASRGSGAFPGHVDIIIHMGRYDAERQDDRRRSLKVSGRFDEREMVIELNSDGSGYQSVGTEADATRDDRLAVIDKILRSGKSLTLKELRDRWPQDGIPKPSQKTLERDVGTPGRYFRTGEGKRGSAYQYALSCQILDTGHSNDPELSRKESDSILDRSKALGEACPESADAPSMRARGAA